MKAGFKNDAEIERRKKELTNFKQTTSQRVRDFESLIDEQYVRAYGRKLAESADPDVALLRENTKKDIVYKGLLPPIAEELWHRTSATTTYAQLISLAKEVELILNRKALLRPETVINQVAANESVCRNLNEEFDVLTIDELNSSSLIDSNEADNYEAVTFGFKQQQTCESPTVERTCIYSIHANKSAVSDSRSRQDATRPSDRKNVAQWRNRDEYRGGAKPDTPVSRHANRPDYPQRFRPQQTETNQFSNFRKPRVSNESTNRPWMLRRSTGHQTSNVPFQNSDSRRPSLPPRFERRQQLRKSLALIALRL